MNDLLEIDTIYVGGIFCYFYKLLLGNKKFFYLKIG